MKSKNRKLPRIAGLTTSAVRADHASSSARSGDKRDYAPGAVIAVYSVKGGVGKTTFAANLAWCSSAQSGCETLLWDLDAAGGSGFLFDRQPHASRNVEDVFTRGRSVRKLIARTAYPHLDLLPADETARALDARLLQIGKRRRLARLTDELARDYARIFLDCPPVMNELSAQILRAADLVIVPLPPSPLSARALDMVVAEIAGSGKRHPPILPVFSMIDIRRTLHRDARIARPEWPMIPYASAIEQGAVKRRPVGDFSPQSPAAKAFSSLWKAIEAKLEMLRHKAGQQG